MDEPFSSLDAVTTENLQSLILDLCSEHGITLVIVTHAIEEAAAIGKKILLLKRHPNVRPRIIENPSAGKAHFQHTDAFRTMCSRIREELGDETP